jgi:hypothetical protein
MTGIYLAIQRQGKDNAAALEDHAAAQRHSE